MVDFNELKKQQQASEPKQSEKPNGKKRPVLYPNTGSISVVLAPAKKGKYGYLMLVKPIYGTYYSGKEKKSYGVTDLQKQNIDTVYLKIKDEDLANALQKGMVLIYNPKKSKKLMLYNVPSGGDHG